MRFYYALSELPEGQCAVVLRLTASGTMRKRLQDIGFIESTRVECVMKSPLGDPIAYAVRGAVIALRAEDAACVIVQPLT